MSFFGLFGKRPHERLEEVVNQLRPSLNRAGFHYEPGDSGVGHGGTSETGYFRLAPIEIGLIMRSEGLGLPLYLCNTRQVSAGHDELIEQLGRSDDAQLKFNRNLEVWDIYTVDGRPAAEALLLDLENIILPVIREGTEHLREAIVTAAKKRVDGWTNK